MKSKAVILDQLRRLKQMYLPNDKLILFGSQARGEATSDSDWDLLLILNKSQRDQADMKHYLMLFYKLGVELDEYFSTKIYTREEWERSKPSLFYKNVQSEGIEIV